MSEAGGFGEAVAAEGLEDEGEGGREVDAVAGGDVEGVGAEAGAEGGDENFTLAVVPGGPGAGVGTGLLAGDG